MQTESPLRVSKSKVTERQRIHGRIDDSTSGTRYLGRGWKLSLARFSNRKKVNFASYRPRVPRTAGRRFRHYDAKRKRSRHVVQMPKGLIQRGRIVESGTDVPVAGYFEYWTMTDNPAVTETPMLKTGDQRNRYVTDDQGYFEIPVLPGRGILTFMANDDQRFPRAAGAEAIRLASGSGIQG